jgi:V/A-type H+/Na+-transporting ATPase subunit I
MFKPVPMMRVSAVVLQRDQRAVLKDWGRLGTVQLMPSRAGTDTAQLAPRDYTSELTHCEHLLARAAGLRQALGMAEGQKAPERLELILAEAERQFGAIEAQAGELLERRAGLVRHLAELSAVREQVSKYAGLELPLDEPGHFDFLHFITGSLPAENLAGLKLGEHVALLPLAKENKRQSLVVMTTRSERAALDEALEAAGFQAERLPGAEGATADSLCEQSRREQETVGGELLEVNEQVRRLAGEAAQPLATLERLAALERRLLEAEQMVSRTESAAWLSGWVPRADVPALERRLGELTQGRCVLEAHSPIEVPEEQVPVLLRHPRLLRPFEGLVAAYGLPTYRELEPTLFVAVSFVLMFGMMFGDAGEGAVLALGGAVAVLAGSTSKVRDVGWVVLFGGLSSIAFGVAYGSYFGLTQLRKYALWHDPLQGHPMDLMYGAIGLGVVLMSLGLVLNVVNRFRRGDVLGGLLSKFGVAGMLFYWGALALLTQHAALQSRGLVNMALALFLGLPLLGWALQGPLVYALRPCAAEPSERAGGLLGALTESLLGAFEAVLSFLANTVSFVRLAAYAMSHAALLVATFAVAAEVERASRAGSVLIIIAGNLVAIVLEGLIASVQALRLEYYEFFGKFFSGAGQPFKPFQLYA